MAAKKPNVLVIWGDDIGQSNLSCYTHGMMGYRTPNIDRIAKEGVMFTDYYAEQSCTAGRASFIMGQCGLRTGLTKVGLPSAEAGMQAVNPTIARAMKNQGYRTGQFGKNHLGDRDEHLPTMHGFDEFFGNLYHLNAEEEPEHENYPKDPEFLKKFGPRGVLHCWADGKGCQKIENTGMLTRKRMETVDEEFLDRAKGCTTESSKTDERFFVWFNTTHMHAWTHAKPESVGQAGKDQSIYHDVMIDHDKHVGQLLDLLDELGLAEDTLVFYSTDNGPHCNTWPDAGTTPFRSEKNTNWEGAFRVPAMVRWPGKIEAGTVCNDLIAHLDWFPTIAAVGGDTTVKERLMKGETLNGVHYKVHLDGHNMLPFLTGEVKESPRKGFVYFSDDGDIVALRYQNWKIVFMEQRSPGTLGLWANPFVTLRAPTILNLRTDPYEFAQITSNTFYDWMFRRIYLLVPAQALIGKFLETFAEFPPSQKAASFNLEGVMKKMEETAAGA